MGPLIFFFLATQLFLYLKKKLNLTLYYTIMFFYLKVFHKKSLINEKLLIFLITIDLNIF